MDHVSAILAPGTSHYDVLGVPATAEAAAVRRAYLVRATKVHPDKHAGAAPEDQARVTEAFQRVSAAYDVLSNPPKRREYDARVASGAPADDDWNRAGGDNDAAAAAASRSSSRSSVLAALAVFAAAAALEMATGGRARAALSAVEALAFASSLSMSDGPASVPEKLQAAGLGLRAASGLLGAGLGGRLQGIGTAFALAGAVASRAPEGTFDRLADGLGTAASHAQGALESGASTLGRGIGEVGRGLGDGATSLGRGLGDGATSLGRGFGAVAQGVESSIQQLAASGAPAAAPPAPAQYDASTEVHF